MININIEQNEKEYIVTITRYEDGQVYKDQYHCDTIREVKFKIDLYLELYKG